MDLKEQRKIIFLFSLVILLVVFHFTTVMSLNNIKLRIDNLERNQISLSSKVAELEANIIEQVGMEVKVTAYNAVKEQTDNTPDRTASNKKPKVGYCGVSRDLEKLLDLKFGDLFYLEGINRYKGRHIFPMCEFQDRMHKRKKMQVDIYMKSVKEAKEFGIRKAKLFIIRRDE